MELRRRRFGNAAQAGARCAAEGLSLSAGALFLLGVALVGMKEEYETGGSHAFWRGDFV